MRRVVFHALRRRPPQRNERMHVDLLLADPACDRHYVPDCISRHRRHSESPADSGKHLPSDADIFPHYIPWHWLYIFVQLLCFCPAGGGKFRPSTDFSCSLQSFKHCTGSLVCHRTAFRCGRSGRCHGNCPGGIRHRYYDCCTPEKPTAVSVKRTAYFSKKYTF